MSTQNFYTNFLRNIHYFFASIFQAFLRNFTPISWQKHKDLTNKLVLITGAGGGIGFELAKIFAIKGARLILWDSNTEANQRTENVCKALTTNIVFSQTINLTNRHEVYEKAEEIKRKFGAIDFLINNAGIINVLPFLETSDEKIDLLTDVNIKSLYWTTKAFLPDMLKKGSGHLVSLSSVAGLVGSPDLVDYSASKFAVFGFMEALEHQLNLKGHKGIDFTTVCPIYVQTQMLDSIKIFDPKIIILMPEYVARRIVEAIQINQRVIMLPRKMYWLYAAKSIFPWNIYQHILLGRRFKYA